MHSIHSITTKDNNLDKMHVHTTHTLDVNESNFVSHKNQKLHSVMLKTHINKTN